MKPSVYADTVIIAEKSHDAYQLAHLFTLSGPIPQALLQNLGDPRPNKILFHLRKCQGYLTSPWEEMCQHQLLALYHLSIASSFPLGSSPDALDPQGKTQAERLSEACDAINVIVTAFLRHFSSLNPGRWALPLLRTLLLNLRWISIQADAATTLVNQSNLHSASNANHAAPPTDSRPSQKRLEECARQLNKAFTACVADRNPDLAESKKWGTYDVVGMVFKTYFKLKSISLCKNILRALSAGGLPPLQEYPRAQQVTFRYFVGVLAFLGEEYAKAEADLDFAFRNCHKRAFKNQELILTYLVPARLVRGSLPSEELLSRFPRLSHLYSNLIQSFRKGDVRSFDQELSSPAKEKSLVKLGTYLSMERSREGCLRGLFRRVWLAKKKETRLKIDDFWLALKFVGMQVSKEEAEWYIANMIFKGYMKGYIAHERGMLVLSAKEAFPNLGTFTVPTS
ncbi:protein CSN12 [Violaceomyces palustris]|uniref:Protein CSN12 n=1 Tax=Violaceomyces palustris TaxID=1673888 RepID=A0ACD0P0E0_9BASI|nr:protein CSN12 [Violaceomyces palustris]